MACLRILVFQVSLVLCVFSPAAIAAQGDIVLAEKGTSRVVILADDAVMGPDAALPKGSGWQQGRDEQLRRLLRESILDLQRFLGEMSGAKILITTPGTQTSGVIPVYTGPCARAKFGRPKATHPERQDWRLVVTEKELGCVGDTDEGASYAIYELLDRLGCRWYMPGTLGMLIPKTETLRMATVDVSGTPHFYGRAIWSKDADYLRRNRLGGVSIAAAHCLENYVTRADKQQYPEIAGVRPDGKADPEWVAFNWASPKSAEIVSDRIIAELDRTHAPSISLSPRDSTSFSQSPEERAWDAADMDPAFGTISLTDRLLTFANTVAERVLEKHPDTVFGLYAYVNYTRPPVKVRPHPRIAIGLAPITLNRVHPMNTPDHPCGAQLQDLVTGWAQKHNRLFFRGYLYNLAEVTAPCPMIAKWSYDLPVFIQSGFRYWLPESMASFDANLPALWLSVRLSWHTEETPDAALRDLYAGCYGKAAETMRQYWQRADDAWVLSKEWSGGGAGHSMRFPPAVLAEMRALMDKALALAEPGRTRQCVELADANLRLFERFMTLKEDFGAGRFSGLSGVCDAYLAQCDELEKQYKENEAFQRYGKQYFARYWEGPYREAATLDGTVRWLTPALTEWHYRKEATGSAYETLSDVTVSSWPVTDVTKETWATVGLYSHMGAVSYRTSVKLDTASTPARVWIGKVAGTARVWINGREAPCTGAKPSGYSIPLTFVADGALKAGTNELCITVERTTLSELGVGGLMGPVRLYREK